MAVTYDNVSSANLYPQSLQSFNHTIGSGSDRILLVGACTVGGGSLPTFTTMSYNSVAMTQLFQLGSLIFGRYNTLTVFYLLESSLPTGGGTYSVAYQTASGPYSAVVHAISFANVIQSAPTNTNTTQSSQNPAATSNVATSLTTLNANSLLVDFITYDTEQITNVVVTPGQVGRSTLSQGGSITASTSTLSTTSAGNYTMEWNPGSSYFTHVHRLIELVDVAGGGDLPNNTLWSGINF